MFPFRYWEGIFFHSALIEVIDKGVRVKFKGADDGTVKENKHYLKSGHKRCRRVGCDSD